jgi:hypothetical protein
MVKVRAGTIRSKVNVGVGTGVGRLAALADAVLDRPACLSVRTPW